MNQKEPSSDISSILLCFLINHNIQYIHTYIHIFILFSISFHVCRRLCSISNPTAGLIQIQESRKERSSYLYFVLFFLTNTCGKREKEREREGERKICLFPSITHTHTLTLQVCENHLKARKEKKIANNHQIHNHIIKQ